MMTNIEGDTLSVTVDKALLHMMLWEYWEPENNKECAGATILFLRKVGFNTHEISQIVENDFNATPNDLSEIEDEMDNYIRFY